MIQFIIHVIPVIYVARIVKNILDFKIPASACSFNTYGHKERIINNFWKCETFYNFFLNFSNSIKCIKKLCHTRVQIVATYFCSYPEIIVSAEPSLVKHILALVFASSLL